MHVRLQIIFSFTFFRFTAETYNIRMFVAVIDTLLFIIPLQRK